MRARHHERDRPHPARAAARCLRCPSRADACHPGPQRVERRGRSGPLGCPSAQRRIQRVTIQTLQHTSDRRLARRSLTDAERRPDLLRGIGGPSRSPKTTGTPPRPRTQPAPRSRPPSAAHPVADADQKSRPTRCSDQHRGGHRQPSQPGGQGQQASAMMSWQAWFLVDDRSGVGTFMITTRTMPCANTPRHALRAAITAG